MIHIFNSSNRPFLGITDSYAPELLAWLLLMLKPLTSTNIYDKIGVAIVLTYMIG